MLLSASESANLIKLLKYYIEEPNLPKIAECRYNHQYNLLDIAHLINNLSDYKVPIKQLDSTIGSSYIGKTYTDLPYIGLEKGIQEVYNIIK